MCCRLVSNTVVILSWLLKCRVSYFRYVFEYRKTQFSARSERRKVLAFATTFLFFLLLASFSISSSSLGSFQVFFFCCFLFPEFLLCCCLLSCLICLIVVVVVVFFPLFFSLFFAHKKARPSPSSSRVAGKKARATSHKKQLEYAIGRDPRTKVLQQGRVLARLFYVSFVRRKISLKNCPTNFVWRETFFFQLLFHHSSIYFICIIVYMTHHYLLRTYFSYIVSYHSFVSHLPLFFLSFVFPWCNSLVI